MLWSARVRFWAVLGADWVEVLVESLPRMDSDSAMPHLLALVLGRFPDARLGRVVQGILLEALLRRCWWRTVLVGLWIARAHGKYDGVKAESVLWR